MKNICSVADYIAYVSDVICKNNIENRIVVFRGETEDFGETSCVPNIFRKKLLENNKRFEKNLFDEMTANNVAVGNTYLEKAISAQHDGFPSRLLDVSYNSLIALYFACTPYYHDPEELKDKEDGKVFLFFIEKMFCPAADNIVSNYDEIIKGDKKSFILKNLFNSNHKLIDHIKTNKRIIAQQGAFILFQGNDYNRIPERLVYSITIPHEAKPRIRKELKDYFGIYTGSVYPQPENFVKDLEQKSTLVDGSEFSLKNELKLSLHNFEENLKYWLEKIYGMTAPKKITKKIVEIEKYIKEFKVCIREVEKWTTEAETAKEESFGEVFEDFLMNYNAIVKEFADEVSNYCEDDAEALYKQYQLEY